MIFLPLAAAATPAPPAPVTNFEACVAMVDADPAKAVEMAGDWRIKGGGLDARQCLGLALAAQSRWPAAMAAFEQAAHDAEGQKDARSAALWVQAGNAALASGDYRRAQTSFDAALAKATLPPRDTGEVHLDRARALVALREPRPARADLEMALKLVPEDPLAWLLSATLARRDGDLARAASDIAEAGKRAPDDASVALEAGNIAILSGADEAARTAWAAAINASPDSVAGKAAAENLAQLPPLPESPPPAAE